MLWLWRYEVKDFEKRRVFFVFCIFLHEKNTKQHDFNIFRKLRTGATTIVSWEISPKKEGACARREIHTVTLQNKADILQKSDIDYKVY